MDSALSAGENPILESARELLRQEGAGWVQIGDNNGISLAAVREYAVNLRVMANEHPLHKRGAQLRASYIFGDGLVFNNTTNRIDNFIRSDSAQLGLFSAAAMERLNLERFCAGNVFVLRDTTNNGIVIVPVEEISEIRRDQRDSSIIRWIKRTWDAGYGMQSCWYPTAVHRREHQRLRKPTNDGVPVDTRSVFYHLSSSRHAGTMLGVPDSLAGAVWSIAYSGYLRDSAMLSKALSQIAWQIINSNNRGKQQSATEFAQRANGVGATVSTGPNQQVSNVGVPSAQVNYGNGQPLASMVATSFGVPVIALLSSPGATGGSYGAATTLDQPTLTGFKMEQRKWQDFFLEILRDIDPRAKKITVKFPLLERDPAYREVQSIATAFATGAVHRDEYRQAVLDRLSVPDLHGDTLPSDDDVFTGVNKRGDPIARQGNQGAVPGGFDQGDTNNEA